MSKDLISLKEINTKNEKFDVIEDDINLIQTNLTQTQDKLANHLNELIEFSKNAQHPQVYNAVAKVAIAISQLNKDALEVIKYKQNLYKQNNIPEESSSITYNTDARTINFVGTPKDLLKKLEEEENEENY